MSTRPPLLARLLLVFRVPADHREFVTGDLNETYEQMAARSGVRAARRWYWHQALIAACTRWPKSSAVTCQTARGDSPVHTLLQDLRFGCRLLWRSPGFAVVAVLTLGLGIGANTTIFSWINSVLLMPIPGAADSGRLVEFSQTFQGSRYSLSYPDYADYRAGTKLLSGLAARDEQALHITVDGVPERAWAELVSANFFDVLGVRPALGRAFLAEEDRTPGAAPVAVISYGLWQRRFGGDPAVISRRVEINGHPFTIVGVTARGFQGSQTALSYDLWVPMMMQPVIMPGASRLSQRDNHWLSSFGRLAPDVSVPQARAEMEGITRQLVKGRPEYKDFSVRMALLRDSSDGAVSVLRPVLLALAIVVGLVLVIACANLANLMIARGAARQREIAIRSSMGASRSRIVRQLLSESMLVAAGGAVVALLIARWTAGLLLSFAPPSEFPISIDVPLDVRVLAFTGVAAALTSLFFGLVPALQASRNDFTLALKEGSQAAGSSRRRLRDALVVAEVALSLALLVAAGLCVRSIQKSRQFDPSFNPNGVLLTSVDLFPAGYTRETGRVFFGQLLDRLQTLPGAESVTLARRVPLGFTGSSSGRGTIEGYTPKPGEVISLPYNTVGPDYFKTMQTPLVAGRDIARGDERGRPNVAVINETMARRYWPEREAVGGRFRFGGEEEWITVVGVARDVKLRTLNEPPRPYVYLPVLQYYHPSTVVHVRTSGDPMSLASSVRQAVQAIDPNLPTFATRTLAAHVGGATFQQRMAGSLLSVFGGLAIALAAVGLYGVLAFIVSRRTREIGVRMALGATRSSVFRLVVGHGLKLTGIGAVIGVAAAFGIAKALSSILFGVDAHDPVTLGGSIAVLALSAMAACLIPALRAIRVDPVRALKYE